MKPKIGIILTTFLRDDLLLKSYLSIMNNWQPNWNLIIVDQNPTEQKVFDYSCSYVTAPFNCGLSMARNFGVEEAQRLGCEYCLITADSIQFEPSMRRINELLPLFEADTKLGRVGFHLQGRLNWEGELSLIPNKCFRLTLIDTTKEGLYSCNCIKNFFIARTTTLLEMPWDNNLKMAEHEDFQYIYGTMWDTLYSTFYKGTYIGKHEGEYNHYRQKNWNESMDYLFKKYNLQWWLEYTNSELFNKGA